MRKTVFLALAILLALEAGRICNPLNSSPKTFIHEFPHPRIIVHYHPVAGEQFKLDHVRFALTHAVHAIELDLHYRVSDDQIVVNHDEATPDSPTLTQVMELILSRKKDSPTVNSDDRQFFMVLEPKENDERLFAGITKILSGFTEHLSTAVKPGDGPRGITIVVTGEHLRTFYSRFPTQQINRLCIVEGHPYDREIVNLSRDQIPFQWVDAIEHNENVHDGGRVNGLHAGTDAHLQGKSNVRIWNCHQELRSCLATGADEINVDRNEIELFEQLIKQQDFNGGSPSLSVRGTQALLTWRDSVTGDLYLALGAVESSRLIFSRQVLLTSFLSAMPIAHSHASALAPDGRLFIVYEGDDSGNLRYVCGKFTSPDQFLTFGGKLHQVVFSNGSIAVGRNPTVAINAEGHVIVVYQANGDNELRYVSGILSPDDELVVNDHPLIGENGTSRGLNPTVALSGHNQIFVAYGGVDGQSLRYFSGNVDASGQITGREFSLGERLGSVPSVALGPSGHVLLAYRAKSADVDYISGKLDSEGRLVDQQTSRVGMRTGTHPSVVLTSAESAVILYEGDEDHKFRYVMGKLPPDGYLPGEEKVLVSGMDRR